MTTKIGVIMDDIATIQPHHDSSFAIMLEAQQRGWPVFYWQQKNIFLKDNIVYAQAELVRLIDNAQQWFEVIKQQTIALHELDVIFMRKDPPIDNAYIYTTQLLDLVAQRGTLVVNKPQSLRDFNEKLFIQLFPQCIPPTLITTNVQQVQEFLQEHNDIICKPLNAMGGRGVFRVQKNNSNLPVIVETLTQNSTQQMMVQRFIPEITQGDKRILLINGKPVPYALARIPKEGEIRANIAAGGHGIGAELTKRDYWICEQIGETLCKQGILFAGIDVIGEYLTEINITSPTCLREIDKLFSLNIAAQLLDCVI